MKFKAKVIEKGPVGWKGKRLFLSQEVINKAVGTMNGIPVCLEHDEKRTVGTVLNSTVDGNWIKCEGTTNVDGYKYVSVAYRAKILNEKGEHNNLPYDCKAEDLECYHLALTNNPRYSDAEVTDIRNSLGVDNDEIIVHNSVEIEIQKEEKTMSFLNVFNSVKEKVEGLTLESKISIENEGEFSVSELIENSKKLEEVTKAHEAEVETLKAEIENSKAEVEELKNQEPVIIVNEKEHKAEDVEALYSLVGENKTYTREEAIKILNEADKADETLKKQINNSKELNEKDAKKLASVNKIINEYNNKRGK